MARWIIDRLLQMVVVLICATLLGFLLVRLLKGNEVFALLGDNYTKQAAAQLNHELGLDKPLPLQYLDWLGGAVHGDFGTSVTTHEPVAHSLFAALGPTVELLVGAQLVALLLTMLVTVVSVRWRWTDRLVTGFALLCSSVPPFVLGLLMIILFASVLHLLPAIAWSWPSAGGWGKNFRGMIMPWVALGISVFPSYMRVLRGQVYEQLDNEEYVTLARMKGLPGPAGARPARGPQLAERAGHPGRADHRLPHLRRGHRRAGLQHPRRGIAGLPGDHQPRREHARGRDRDDRGGRRRAQPHRRPDPDEARPAGAGPVSTAPSPVTANPRRDIR